MPTIEISLKDFKNLSKLNFNTLRLKKEFLTYLKADIEESKKGKLKVKLEDTNRPDLWSVEGLARSLKNIYGKPIKKYFLEKSGITVEVDKNLKNIRPYIACAVLKNVKIDEKFLQSIIQFQEKLSENYGRKRARVAVGVYDFDKINGKKIKYMGIKPNALKFIPLGFDKELSPAEILKNHPKGIKYSKLLKDKKYYPVLLDKANNVLSMPPIINSSSSGKVTQKTKNLFIESTGMDFETVKHVLNVFVAALAMRSGKVYSVKTRYNYNGECGSETTPNFNPSIFQIKPSYIDEVLGLGLTLPEVKKLLKMMGYKILRADSVNDLLVLEIPFYRNDIMHAVDVIEDIAIAYNYDNIPSLKPEISTNGGLLSETERNMLIREVMIGMKFQEVLSFTLTSKENLLDKMNLTESALGIINPISSNYAYVRNSILPMLMSFLEINKTVGFPHLLFELGPIVLPDKKMYNKVRQETHLCAVISHSRATFTEIKSVLDMLLKNLGIQARVKHIKHSSFIEGRCGEIIVGKKRIGFIGEIHPQILENFNLENPVAAFEINVDAL